MKQFAVAIIEYLLGFIALAVFASVAFSAGAPTDDRMLFAFKVGATLAAVELAALLRRSAPANRLIVGANVWLLAGGVAAITQQWWWLKGYQQLGESSLFLSILCVGIASAALSQAGFVGVIGPRRKVQLASAALFLAVLAALAASVHFRGNVKWAGVFPVIALSWVNRLLARAVKSGA